MQAGMVCLAIKQINQKQKRNCGKLFGISELPTVCGTPNVTTMNAIAYRRGWSPWKLAWPRCLEACQPLPVTSRNSLWHFAAFSPGKQPGLPGCCPWLWWRWRLKSAALASSFPLETQSGDSETLHVLQRCSGRYSQDVCWCCCVSLRSCDI